MDIRVLGSLTVQSADNSGVPSAPKQRQALAVLVLQANRLVPNAALLREIWGDRPPRTSGATLQTYIAQLRRFIAGLTGQPLEHIMRQVLTTESGGYRFHLPHGALDLHRFEEAVASGRATLATGSLAEAADLFGSALAMWHGGPLENVRHGPMLEIQARRLEQLRLTISEQRYDADLKLGRHYEVLGDLTELAEQNPLHENFHALLMRALSQSGRRSEALQEFLAMRKRLADELGLDPSPEISALQQSILTRQENRTVFPLRPERRRSSPRRVS